MNPQEPGTFELCMQVFGGEHFYLDVHARHRIAPWDDAPLTATDEERGKRRAELQAQVVVACCMLENQRVVAEFREWRYSKWLASTQHMPQLFFWENQLRKQRQIDDALAHEQVKAMRWMGPRHLHLWTPRQIGPDDAIGETFNEYISRLGYNFGAPRDDNGEDPTADNNAGVPDLVDVEAIVGPPNLESNDGNPQL